MLLTPTTARFPKLLSRQMKKLGYTRKSLAAQVHRSPEHVRKLQTGAAFPGPDLEKRLAEVLTIGQRVVAEAVEYDRWFKKHGKAPPITGRRMLLTPIERLWGSLTSYQQLELACI